ncbi:MAG TPA: HAMP domain-containing sensor histidine kinase [Candidatus Limnocylindria bacterium]|nr:HAMP domain-containing sensor histidine kinase [Candidatus Limnocylindria bacterium]
MSGERRRSPGRRASDHAIAPIDVQDAFVALTDGILLTDPNGAIVSANPAAFRILGENALVGKVFDELLLVSGATSVQETEGHRVRRAWFPREDRMGVLEIVSTALGDRGTLHTVRDVTAQAELLRLKEDFLLQVAHELRTPIAALSATLDLLVEDALSMSRDDLGSMMSTLRRSALRLEHLVDNLLDAGSIEAGTFQVRAIPTSVRSSLQEALVFIQPLVDAKQQHLAVDLHTDSDRVLADPRRTAQVLANLIANASKYAPEGTSITVSSATREGFVRVSVADEGPGIPQDEQTRLFQRFFRSREVRDQAGGLGLGLSICRAIVRAQGGEIGIESAPGRGTSVHFTLPKARHLTEEAAAR